MVESIFSMVKRKFGDGLRAKSELAMKNETLAKFIYHNICCVISGFYERGIDPKFLGLPEIVESTCTKTDLVAQKPGSVQGFMCKATIQEEREGEMD